MSLIIYGIARSRASRTLWMAHELGVPYHHVKLGIADGGTTAPEFRCLNPNGRIPTIDDNGTVVWESTAINLYLAKRYGGPLAPQDGVEDAHMTMWSVWSVSEVEPLAHDVYVHTITAPPGERDTAKIATAIAGLQRPLDALEAALSAGRGFLVGQRFTVADLNVAAVMFYLREASETITSRPVTLAWYQCAIQRPAFKTMLMLRDEG